MWLSLAYVSEGEKAWASEPGRAGLNPRYILYRLCGFREVSSIP